MVLTWAQAAGKGIVQGGVAIGERSTTYDATVGSIIRCGVEIKDASFTLPPRHIIWVVSAETFDMGDSTTGLATLKTQWTHQGVLALNVGVVDPGWNGPLAAAVVNFSSSDFVIEKGAPFFRILFEKHSVLPATQIKRVTVGHSDYVRQVMGYSRSFSQTFLDMDALTRTVADKVLGMPRWGLILSLVAIVIGLLSITVPVGYSIWTEVKGDDSRVVKLEDRMRKLEEVRSPLGQIDPRTCVPQKNGPATQLLCPSPKLP